MSYFLRIALFGTLRGVDALVRGLLGLLAVGMGWVWVESFVKHEPLERPWRTAYISAAVGGLFVIATVGRRKADWLVEEVWPGPDDAPGWIRDGLFGGRYAARVRWTSGEQAVMKAASGITVTLLLCMVVVGCAVVCTFSPKEPPPPWAYSALGYFFAATWCAYAVVAFMKGWHFLHLRLRPLRERSCFEPVMPRPAPLCEARAAVESA